MLFVSDLSVSWLSTPLTWVRIQVSIFSTFFQFVLHLRICFTHSSIFTEFISSKLIYWSFTFLILYFRSILCFWSIWSFRLILYYRLFF